MAGNEKDKPMQNNLAESIVKASTLPLFFVFFSFHPIQRPFYTKDTNRNT